MPLVPMTSHYCVKTYYFFFYFVKTYSLLCHAVILDSLLHLRLHQLTWVVQERLLGRSVENDQAQWRQWDESAQPSNGLQ